MAMFNVLSFGMMTCVAISLPRFIIGRCHGIAFRVSENGINVLLQEPIRMLFREATNDSVELQSIEVSIPEKGKVLAKATAKGGATYQISTGFRRDADGGLRFADPSCKSSDQESCEKIDQILNVTNVDLEKMGTSKDINGKITFHYPLTKDPEIVKGENGATSFAKFVLFGHFGTEKYAKPELNASIQADPEMDKTLADKDIVFVVTSLVIDSFVQALIGSGATKGIILDLSKSKERLALIPAEDAELGKRLQQIVEDFRQNFLATSCEGSEASCLGMNLGTEFQEKYPNDVFAFKLDITNMPAVKISLAGISAEIAANIEFKLESTGAHLFNLLIEVGAQVSNASIADGRVFLVARLSKAPEFKIENDETGGLVKETYFKEMYNLLRQAMVEKLAELSTTGILIPEIPFVKIESSEMITLENRLYFVVDKAAIQIPTKTKGA